MNPDQPDIAGQQAAVIPQVDNPPPPPSRQEVVETPEQNFRRVLSYLYIEEEFITSILNIQRISNFRVAVLLTEQQHNSVITDAQASTNCGFYHDAISFLKLLNAADYYAKQQRISVVEKQWSTFTEVSTTRILSALMQVNDSFPPNIEAFGDMILMWLWSRRTWR